MNVTDKLSGEKEKKRKMAWTKPRNRRGTKVIEETSMMRKEKYSFGGGNFRGGLHEGEGGMEQGKGMSMIWLQQSQNSRSVVQKVGLRQV